MPLPIQQIRIVNISDKTQEVVDSQLPNGRVYVDPHKIYYLPYQVYMRTWRRYDRWMRDVDKPNNKCFLDLVIEDNPLDDVVCPHCRKRYHETETERELRLAEEAANMPKREIREKEFAGRVDKLLEEMSVNEYLKALGKGIVDSVGDMSINEYLKLAKKREILDSKKKDEDTNIEISEPMPVSGAKK